VLRPRAWLAVRRSRLNVTLPEEQAAKLARMAERMHLQPGTLAESLLAQAIDDADPDAARIIPRVAARLDRQHGALPIVLQFTFETPSQSR